MWNNSRFSQPSGTIMLNTWWFKLLSLFKHICRAFSPPSRPRNLLQVILVTQEAWLVVVVKASARGLQRLLTAGRLYGFSFGEFWRKTPEGSDGRGNASQDNAITRFLVFSGCKKEPQTPVLYPKCFLCHLLLCSSTGFTLGLQKGE